MTKSIKVRCSMSIFPVFSCSKFFQTGHRGSNFGAPHPTIARRFPRSRDSTCEAAVVPGYCDCCWLLRLDAGGQASSSSNSSKRAYCRQPMTASCRAMFRILPKILVQVKKTKILVWMVWSSHLTASDHSSCLNQPTLRSDIIFE